MRGPLRVLQSVPPPRPTTNPYVIMLAESLRALPGVHVLQFRWRTVLLGRYDVFHTHWPETLVGGGTPLRRAAHQLLFVAMLVRLRLTRTAVVRTAHNVDLPTGTSRVQRQLLNALDHLVTARIRLNDVTEARGPGRGPEELVTIPHGHYRGWYANRPSAETTPGRIAFVGLVRRYKGVDELLRAFSATRSGHPELRLHVAGAPTSADLAAELSALAAEDPRVTLELHFLDDDELVTELTVAELVVLPARLMHNSGSVLAALSVGRPVLVVDNEVNRALADEVGPGWVTLFAGTLSGDRLVEALEEVRVSGRSAAPDLSARGWDRAAESHFAVYRSATALAAARSQDRRGFRALRGRVRSFLPRQRQT